MTCAAIIAALAALAVFGAVMYRSGRKAAENKALRAKERENAKVDEVMRHVARLNRADLLIRLRERKK